MLGLITRLPIAQLITVYTSVLLIAIIPRWEVRLPFYGPRSLSKLIAEKKYREISLSSLVTFYSEAKNLDLGFTILDNAIIEKNVTRLMDTIRTSKENLFFYDDPFVTRYYAKQSCAMSVVFDTERPGIRQMGFAFPKNSSLGNVSA